MLPGVVSCRCGNNTVVPQLHGIAMRFQIDFPKSEIAQMPDVPLAIIKSTCDEQYPDPDESFTTRNTHLVR